MGDDVPDDARRLLVLDLVSKGRISLLLCFVADWVVYGYEKYTQ
jgi:hypothetical protein